MILFLSKKEVEAIKEIANDRIEFFNQEYHSLNGSMKRLVPHFEGYADFANKEKEKAAGSIKLWEGILKRLRN